MKTKIYKIYWVDGKTTIVTGKTIHSALQRFGYGKTAFKAVNYFEIL